MKAPAIDIRGITHRFGDRVVLDAVSLAVAPGEFVALLGPNGSGKSTLFRILATLMTPTSGSAQIEGRDVVTDPAHARRAFGIVFQSPAVDPVLTARENLTTHGRLYGIGADLAARVDRALQSAGLLDRARDRVGTFSGGMKRRLEIAKALLPEPRVLLLDEPDTGLDVVARAQLREQLRTLAGGGITVLLTTHLMDLADSADRVALLHAGKLVADGPPAALRDAVGTSVLEIIPADILRDTAILRERLALDVTSDGSRLTVKHPEPASLVSRIVDALPEPPRSITVRCATLEDVFFVRTGARIDG